MMTPLDGSYEFNDTVNSTIVIQILLIVIIHAQQHGFVTHTERGDSDVDCSIIITFVIHSHTLVK